ncbi:hypothetical protein ACRW3Y_22415, partial [Escherichia coli]
MGLLRIRMGNRVKSQEVRYLYSEYFADDTSLCQIGFAPIFPDTCYHLTHYWPAAADIPVASDNPVH